MAEIGLLNTTVEIHVRHPLQRPTLAVVFHPEDLRLLMGWTNYVRSNVLKGTGEEADRLAGISVELEKVLKDIESEEILMYTRSS